MMHMRPRVCIAMLLLIAPACASQATSKAATGETIATGESVPTSDGSDSAGTTTTAPCRVVAAPPPPNVQLGDCGPFVIELQTRLNDAGFIIPVDGVYSKKTEDAVKAFQSDRGLTVDGLVGPKTWAKLVEGGVGD
jgi:peptidoglycan hydrolase-like protein with peptidoglycan-binding domain